MKKILILGATGRTGSLALSYALQKGYEVVVLARDPTAIQLRSDRLHPAIGSATDMDALRQAIHGCDAVISALGALHQSDILRLTKIDPPHTLEMSIRNTIACMNEAGIRRIAVVGALGAGDSYSLAPWLMRFLIRHTNFGIVYDDHNMQEQLLAESGLDWTVAWPVGLNMKDKPGHIHVTYQEPPPSYHISRRQVAKFLVDAITDHTYICKAPVISETR